MMNKYTIMRSYYDVVETHSITIYICSLTSATSHQQKYEHGCLFFSCNTYTVQSKPDNHKTLYNATHDVLEQNSDLVRGLTLISALALLRVSIKNHVVCQQLGTNQGEFFRSPKGGLGWTGWSSYPHQWQPLWPYQLLGCVVLRCVVMWCVVLWYVVLYLCRTQHETRRRQHDNKRIVLYCVKEHRGLQHHIIVRTCHLKQLYSRRRGG